MRGEPLSFIGGEGYVEFDNRAFGYEEGVDSGVTGGGDSGRKKVGGVPNEEGAISDIGDRE